jgi:replicative DNA helicase
MDKHAEFITNEGFKSSLDRMANFKYQDKNRYLTFGNRYLDAAMKGILPHDLVLLGAYSGAGKTQFCVNLAHENIKRGKKVHFIALEAEENEIENRIRYVDILGRYYKDQFRPRVEPDKQKINYLDFIDGEYKSLLKDYEPEITPEYYENLKTFYKSRAFDVESLCNIMYAIYHETDLIIVDHVHYFDYDDNKENQALKEIAKKAREICLELGKPMVLVSHLRKKQSGSVEVCPSLDEFHGSSDLVKIATKVVTLARGEFLGAGEYETLCRIPKCRVDGSVTNFVGKLTFSANSNTYLKNYSIGLKKKKNGEYVEIETANLYPEFIKRKTIYD